MKGMPVANFSDDFAQFAGMVGEVHFRPIGQVDGEEECPARGECA